MRPTDYCMQITLSSDEPSFCGPRRLSYRKRCEAREKLDELLGTGIIRPNNSPYAFPVVLVMKKNGEFRMCVDHRSINRVT